MKSELFNSIVGSVAGAIVVFMMSAVWRYAAAVRKNTEEISNLAKAYHASHTNFETRINELSERLARLEGR